MLTPMLTSYVDMLDLTEIEPSDRILISVSGGPDSVFLLHTITKRFKNCGIIHIDHGTRNGDSRKDSEFVKELSKCFNLPFFLKTCDVEEECKTSKMSFEQYARFVRYKFIDEIVQKHNYNVVVTGHHLGDQAESILMRIIMGTSVEGLRGIPYVRHMKNYKIVRPLLKLDKNQILTYLNLEGIEYKTDYTNSELNCVRNKIRNQLLPMISENFNENVVRALTSLSALAQLENDYIEQQTMREYDRVVGYIHGKDFISVYIFEGLYLVIQKRIVHKLLTKYKVRASHDSINRILDFILEKKSGRKCDIGRRYYLQHENGFCYIRRMTEN